ncbi:hypothetical protein FRB90_003985 [Tulasnella sp. 427]|nr:hypothetical protein FRB90_003985 [Tulasnella sp. 427]
MPLDFSPHPAYLAPTASSSSPSNHSYPPASPATSPRESISSSSTITLVQDDPQPQPRPVSLPNSTSGPPPTADEPLGQSESSPVPTASGSRPSSLQQPGRPPARPPPPSQIMHFLITPDPHLVDTSRGLVHQRVEQQAANQGVSGFFSNIGKRLIGAIEHKNSFTIRIPSPSSPATSPGMLTLLTFYDTTPALRLGTPTTGTIELDEGIARLLGVDRGFYIAACLAYLEFLGDKESYLAASEG